MKATSENYLVWWPLFYFSLIDNNDNHYNQANVEFIDDVITQTEQVKLKLIFTLWDHSQLRGSTQSRNDDRWNANNGFNQLTTASEFFNDEESWQWPQNLYRYIIARWSKSMAWPVT